MSFEEPKVLGQTRGDVNVKGLLWNIGEEEEPKVLIQEIDPKTDKPIGDPVVAEDVWNDKDKNFEFKAHLDLKILGHTKIKATVRSNEQRPHGAVLDLFNEPEPPTIEILKI